MPPGPYPRPPFPIPPPPPREIPLVAALFDTLPAPGSRFGAAKRARFLTALNAIFDVVYADDPEEPG